MTFFALSDVQVHCFGNHGVRSVQLFNGVDDQNLAITTMSVLRSAVKRLIAAYVTRGSTGPTDPTSEVTVIAKCLYPSNSEIDTLMKSCR